MKYVIGVDQGGSGTRAAICSLDGILLGTGAGPGACHAFTGMEVAMDATLTAVKDALRNAGLSQGKAWIYVGGHTGADWDDEYGYLQNSVEALDIADQAFIVNDSIAALRGGTEQPYGAILVAGTGANCAIRAPDGREFIYHYYHDEDLQGGSALGEAALKAIFRAETGRPPQTSLRQRVLAFFGLPDVDSLMRNLVEGSISRERIPEIAPLVFEAAEGQDQAAQEIVIRFGRGCAELLTNGLDNLDMTMLEVEIVLSGGIFKAKSDLLRGTLIHEVRRQVPLARFVDARYEPVVGATLLALEKSGVSLDSALKSNLEVSARGLNLIRI